MTSLTINNWRTPKFIQKDKELKAQYGHGDHTTLTKSSNFGFLEKILKNDTLNFQNDNNKNNQKTLIAVGGTILLGVLLYATRGKIKVLFSNKAAANVNNITERVVKDGKKVQKIVEKTENGANKVTMNVFNADGSLYLSREKVISRSLNAENGMQYVNIKNTYTAPGIAHFNRIAFNKKMTQDINKYYNSDGKLIFKTEKMNNGCFIHKRRIAYNPDGTCIKCSQTNYNKTNNFRVNRFNFSKNDDSVTNFFPQGTALKDGERSASDIAEEMYEKSFD